MNLNSNQEIEVDGFVDDDELLTCLDNLLFADGDMDLKLDRFEYSDFIALESGLRVSAPFEDLDLEFVAIYYAEACTTCYDETNYDECCVGDDAHIDLEGDDPDRLFSTVVYVCGSVNEVLDDMFPDRMEPTASPTSLTASPTTEPTLVPETSQPTTTPTTGPTHMATVPGTQSPTTTPSFSPTTATPTMVPTDEPTRSPVVTERPTSSTELPTLGPTDQPTTAVPTGTPTSSPSSTPTASPTSNPTGTPTEFPTDLPTATPTTAAPTATPTTAAPTGELRPTANPTRTMRPTSSPTAVPTLVPLSQLPTGTPTSAPSTTPTSSPTVMATAFPSLTPSDLPSLLPTGNPDLLCVSFSYQLNNLTGLTPEDILEERNNTLKTGLELAGRNVTIEILNATFPRDQETLVEESEEVPPQSPGFEFHSFRNKHPHHQRYSHMNENGEDRRVRKLDGYFAAVELGVASTFGLDQAQAMLDSSVEVWSSRIPSQEDLNRRLDSSRRSSRRLVFYTDEYPNEVRNVIENPLCEAPEGIICMIVQQVSCVLLEEGDDPEVVRFTLRNGLRDAINNRDFVEAIPPEHIP